MPRTTSVQEEHTRVQMTAAYNAQKAGPNGWQDWGMFTAHVVHGLIEEVNVLRAQIQSAGGTVPSKRNPFD